MSGVQVKAVDGIEAAQVQRSLLGYSLVTCSYWVDGVLIDTGPHRLSKEFLPFFQARKIDKVVLTHGHEDHCGNASFLAGKGVPVYLHEKSVAAAAKPVRIPFYRWVFWQPRPPFQAAPLPPHLETAGGKTLEVIEAPGHTADHVAFYYPEAGALFTGDLFVSTSAKMGWPWENYVAWINSLAILLEYDFHWLCCSHSGIVPRGKQVLAKKLANLRELQGEILRLKEQGLTVQEINRQLFPSMVKMRLFTGGEWDSVHIIRSFLEHSPKGA